jgi:PAS domain S-box-containing protein
MKGNILNINDYIVNSIEDYAIFVLDTEGYVRTWNKGAEKIKGYSEKEILGKHFSIFYPKEAIQANHPQHELEVAQKKGSYEEEGWRIRKNRTLFWASVTITALYEQSNLVGFVKVTRDLTERKKYEEDLRQSEEKFRLLIESTEDYAIFMLDPRGYIMNWNKGAERINGYTEEEILGKHFSVFYPKEAIASNHPQHELDIALKTGRHEEEGWRLRKDRTPYWSNVIITALYNEKNNLIGYSKITKDLTARKHFEEKLGQSEEKFRLLIESIQDYAIFMLDTKGYIKTWNKGAEKIKGYSEQEILGKHFSIFYPQEAIKVNHPQQELEIAAKKGRYEEEGWRLRKDKSLIWANIVITALYNEQRQLVGFAKITRDLTERKNYEENLKQSEEKFRLLVESTEDYAIFMLDPFGYIKSWNKGAEKINGYSEDDAIGKHFSILYTKEDIKAHHPEHELKIAFERGKYEEEGFRIRKDRSLFWANVNITAIFNAQRELIGYAKITRDLTARKKLESILIDFSSLQETNKKLDEFAAVAAHDLKSPLHIISSFISLVEFNEGKSLKKTSKEHIRIIKKNILQLSNLIDNILNYAQLENTELPLSYLEVKAIVEQVLETLSPSKKFQIKYPDNLPVLYANKYLLQQIFLNLISNAIKYNDKEWGKIDITFEEHPEYFIFFVQDNGPGIEEKYHEQIFEVFKKLQSTKKVEGSGLGLNIVKKIVAMIGGKVGVLSEKDKGTTFYFTWPKNGKNPPI